MSEHETVADIIREMRDAANSADAWRAGMAARVVMDYADRVETAARRERDLAVEHATRHAEAVARDNCRDCVHNPSGKNFEGGNGGNAAAVREALLFVKQYFDKIDPFNPNTYTFAQIEVDHIQDAISAALSKPPRHCDVGTPEEQGERCLAEFDQWRRKSDGKKLITAIMTWAQMPYTAEEGGAK